jgi:hypothetical protein
MLRITIANEYRTVCFEEMPYQLIKEKRLSPSLSAHLEPGKSPSERFDYEYERALALLLTCSSCAF